jgi:predicted DsbA family dithiol-disulfide isomerase
MLRGCCQRREHRSAKFGSWEYSQCLAAEVAEAGRQAGLEFHHERMERTPNTFDAHRLIWLTEKRSAQDAVIEGLFAGYFTNGRDVGDRPVLTDIAVQAGLNRAKVEVLLAGYEGAEEVRQSERAAYESGVSGVPAVSVNGQPAFSVALKAETMIAKIRAAAGAVPIAHGSSPAGTAPVRQAR